MEGLVMAEIFDYDDYRDMIKDYYLEHKKHNSLYSFSTLGKTLGLDSIHAYYIVQKKRNLPVHAVPAAKKMLGLDGRGAAYFDLLIVASRTKSEKTKAEILQKAFQLRDVKRHLLKDNELKYLSAWWTIVVRALIEVKHGNVDIPEIANSVIPPITEEQAQESIEILKSLGFIQPINNNTKVRLADPHITVQGAEKAQAIRSFHSKVMQFGIRSLSEIPPENRDISTITMAVDSKGFEDLKKMLKEFRKEIQIRVDKCIVPDRVMQLNLALFPVALNKKKDK
jgi:uncharacterized protein (TIGR02147 family)